jgi:hypothetical protein
MRLTAVLALSLLGACAEAPTVPRGADQGRPLPPRAVRGFVLEAGILSLSGTISGESLSITNLGDLPWRDCTIQLNTEVRYGPGFLDPWEAPAPRRVAPGATVTLPLASFQRWEDEDVVTLDGERLAAFQWKDLLVTCRTPRGYAAGILRWGERPVEGPPFGPGAEIGVPYEYPLYTHCGVLWAEFDGRLWDASPPLAEPTGNPPPGWGNPYDTGTITLLQEDVAVFRSSMGEVARFRPRPPGLRDPPPCA